MKHRLFDLILNEFIQIVTHIIEAEKYTKLDASRLYIESNILKELLNKFYYRSAEEKLRYWMKLNLLDNERGRLTRRLYIEAEKKYRREICINMESYQIVKKQKNKRLEYPNVPRSIYDLMFRNNGQLILELMGSEVDI